ncbi:MAG: biotin synthase BioB [Thermodesulfobacteriota bacterium]
MNAKTLFELAEALTAGADPDPAQLEEIARLPEADTLTLLAGADRIREHYFGKTVHLCCICNGKSGRCSEDCRFCSQSAHARTDAPVYGLMPAAELRQIGLRAACTPINRYSIVTSGRGLPREEVRSVADALAGLNGEEIATCASLGILDPESLALLTAAGVSRYHHNLETARSFFDRICGTHTYEERVETIRAAKAAGMSVCAGGIFGLGESDAQVLELALALRELEVDSVPVNFLVPIPGTPLENRRDLTPLRCLKIIALLRYALPDRDILVCGGREANLQDLHPLIFFAGASGVMTGNYLTTTGVSLESDLAMLQRLGFTPRPKAGAGH